MEILVPHNFNPREYQLPFLEAWDSGKYKRFDLVQHRRSGKDKVCVAATSKAMIDRVGAYYYIFPEFNQGRKALWDNVDGLGFRTLKHIPEELWASENGQQMKLTLKNGSYLQIVGSGDFNRLVGTNPVGIVFSEWSLQNPTVLGYMDPILRENKGWAIFNYTPRGNNHAKSFHEDAVSNDKWWSNTLTVADTHIFSKDELIEIEMEYKRQYGDTSLFQQEYYCDFSTPVQGAIYASEISQATREDRILDNLEYDPNLKVHTAWDLGVSDSTVIWFYQRPNADTVNIIDYYEAYGKGMQHFYDILNTRGYDYGNHYLPHDAANRVQAKESEAVSRKDMLQQMGLSNLVIVPAAKLQDGIQQVRKNFYKLRFNSQKCKRGLECLKEYQREWNQRLRTYSSDPLHNWASHAADALRYLVMGLEDLATDTTYKDPNINLNKSWTDDTW